MKLRSTYRLFTVLILFTVVVAFNVNAAGLPWDEHGEPFSFLFGNHFDDHQQSKVNGSKDKLMGFLYIRYTDGTEGAEYGLPDAEHGTDTVGWVLDGLPLGTCRLPNTAWGELGWPSDNVPGGWVQRRSGYTPIFDARNGRSHYEGGIRTWRVAL